MRISDWSSDVCSSDLMGHIQLSRDADLLVVAPASADILEKMAQGRSDDLASTALPATDKPVLVAPAMNVRMWAHEATRTNLAQLKTSGAMHVSPHTGAHAEGQYAVGAMRHPHEKRPANDPASYLT